MNVNNKGILRYTGFYSMSSLIPFVTNILQTGAHLRFRHLLSNTHLTLDIFLTG